LPPGRISRSGPISWYDTNRTYAETRFFSDDATRAAEAAWDRPREEAQERGVPVSYRDYSTGIEILHKPDGRRFEIQFIASALRGENFEILGELPRTRIE
jgi:hypothetical protein